MGMSPVCDTANKHLDPTDIPVDAQNRVSPYIDESVDEAPPIEQQFHYLAPDKKTADLLEKHKLFSFVMPEAIEDILKLKSRCSRKIAVIYIGNEANRVAAKRCMLVLASTAEVHAVTFANPQNPLGSIEDEQGNDILAKLRKLLTDSIPVTVESVDADDCFSIRTVPRIDASTGDLVGQSNAAWEAINSYNDPPKYFSFDRLPAYIETKGQGAYIRHLDRDGLRNIVARSSYWFKGRSETQKYPPKDVIANMLSDITIPLPQINRIVTAPIFNADGILSTSPGYNGSAKVFYHPAKGFDISDIPERPSQDDICAAKTFFFDDLLVDFPFCGNADKANYISAMLLPFVREMIPTQTPLHLLEKPTPRTGASLLADLLYIVFNGKEPFKLSEAESDAEWRKRITSTLLDTPTHFIIDNVNKKLTASSLCQAISEACWQDRLMAKSKNALLPVKCVWVVTGNNPQLSNEIAKRTISIRLDAREEDPGQRDTSKFRHPNIKTWAKEHRSELVWSALILIQEWIAQGKQKDKTATLGGFEEWAETMGGILKAVDIPGFMANQKDLYDRADGEFEQWRSFFTVWYDKHQETPLNPSSILALTENNEHPFYFKSGADENSKKKSIGNQIKKQQDRIYGNLQLKHERTEHRSNLWRLDKQLITHP